MGAFDSLFCPEGRAFVHHDCSGGRVSAPFKLCPGGMVLDEIDTCIMYQNEILKAICHSYLLLKLQLHDAIYRLQLCSNSLIHILSLSNSHNNVASLQKKSGR